MAGFRKVPAEFHLANGLHRRTAREALASAVPPGRKKPPVSDPWKPLIVEWLETDRSAIVSAASSCNVTYHTVIDVIVPGLVVDFERLREVCRRYGVARLEVFGSVSRGDAKPESDVDVLYELEPGARLGWGIEKLVDDLSVILGRRVDLVSRNALHEQLRDKVLAEARVLYAA